MRLSKRTIIAVKGVSSMTDERIVDLYWKRDESAVAQTQEKYGHYLTKIAYNILGNMEDSLESVNDTYMRAWKAMPLTGQRCCLFFLQK